MDTYTTELKKFILLLKNKHCITQKRISKEFSFSQAVLSEYLKNDKSSPIIIRNTRNYIMKNDSIFGVSCMKLRMIIKDEDEGYEKEEYNEKESVLQSSQTNKLVHNDKHVKKEKLVKVQIKDEKNEQKGEENKSITMMKEKEKEIQLEIENLINKIKSLIIEKREIVLQEIKNEDKHDKHEDENEIKRKQEKLVKEIVCKELHSLLINCIE